jgi:phage anti-repressor protein
MTTTALVPVFTGDNGITLCNARDLHTTLENGDHFATWIKERIEKYGFTEGEDFFGNSRKTRGRPATDYHLTLDMAKELAMVENNERGRKVRRYFIQVEKDARAKVGAGGTALPAPAFDLRATMLAGGSTPTVTLPAEVQAAINRKAWAMAGSAYDLCREFLARQVAYSSEVGNPRRINEARALAAIAETTLDMALAPRHHDQLSGILLTMQMVADLATKNVATMRAELKQKGMMQ